MPSVLFSFHAPIIFTFCGELDISSSLVLVLSTLCNRGYLVFCGSFYICTNADFFRRKCCILYFIG